MGGYQLYHSPGLRDGGVMPGYACAARPSHNPWTSFTHIPNRPGPGINSGGRRSFGSSGIVGTRRLKNAANTFQRLSGVPSVSSRVFCFAWPSKIGAWNRKQQSANGYYREFDKLRPLFTAAKSAFDFMIFTVGNPPEGQQ